MAFDREVERFVPGWQPAVGDLLTNTAQQQNARDNASIQTRRWQVLLGCFALVLVVGQPTPNNMKVNFGSLSLGWTNQISENLFKSKRN